MIVGIDLGTTNSLIGVMEAGFPILLADANGSRLTPSVVHFPETGEALVGTAANRMRAVGPAATVYSAKRLIGLRGDDASAAELPSDYEIVRQAGRALRIRVRDREYASEEISALVLGKLKRDAEAALDQPVTRAVITVPAYFNDAQRNATKAAGEAAGFTVERIINEPTAAALAYGLDKLAAKSKIAVYDLGGGTFDISILELDNGVFQVLATSGNTHLGGDDVDAALVAACQLPIPNWQKRELVIEAKHRLSTEESVRIDAPFVGGENFTYELTREALEKIARPIIQRTRGHCLRALADAKLDAAKLDEVILVGGMTRMPLVRQFVAELFGREPNISQNPDEAVALGATIQAGILSGAVRDVVLLDVTPLSLGIETFGGLMNVIIPRNSTIPVRAGEMFTTAVNKQRAMKIKVLQGEREMAADNWMLGEFEIEFRPAPKGVARVGVQFEIDADGILNVLARDTQTGTEKIVALTSAVDVSDEAVEAMIADSLEHAFEDMSERVWTETRLKAEEMLGAVEKAFKLAGDRLPAEQKKEIAGLTSAVREAIASHETPRLKAANAALDDATQELAALIVEQAMAASATKA
ncbi:MAG: Hsp70 family protein [Chthoniobacterales bacterium]|nr:Hsp70 family protein [Chthoniobacterales bacterium]